MDKIKTHCAILNQESISELQKNISIYEYKEDAPLLNKGLWACHPTDAKDDKGTPISLILCWQKDCEGYSIQAAFTNQQALKNNFYNIYVYDWVGKKMYFVLMPSRIALPPVWDRLFVGFDYFDYVLAQKVANSILEKFNLDPIEVDVVKEGKMVSCIGCSFDEALEKLKKGESYPIIGVKAELVNGPSI